MHQIQQKRKEKKRKEKKKKVIASNNYGVAGSDRKESLFNPEYFMHWLG